MLGLVGLSGNSKGEQVVTPELLQRVTTVSGIAALFFYLRTTIFHAMDVCLAYARGLPRLREKNAYLKGLYAPTDLEATDEDLAVTGDMPADMNGIYVRVGPNPRHHPIGNYHWFDGHGMTHAVRIKEGKAAYANRYVQTHRLKAEAAAGYPLYEKIGDAAGAGYLLQAAIQKLKAITCVIDVSKGAGHANTALVFHAKRLLALEEGDMPYALRVLCNGVMETLGRADWNGKLKHAFTAHPKKDPVTGELYSFGYNINRQPYANFTLIGADGNIKTDFPVHLPDPVMMHDCALTEDHFIFLDNPLCLKPERIVKDGTLPFMFDKSRASRFGLLPRDAKDEKAIRWFKLPAMMIFHVANAWQETSDVVKLAACCFDEFELDIGSAHFRTPAHMPRMYMLTFDLRSGKARRDRVAATVGDFPRVPDSLIAPYRYLSICKGLLGGAVGRKTRFAYLATMPEDGDVPGFSGVTKLDLAAGSEAAAVAGQIKYPKDWEGGEAYFVEQDASNGHRPDEDEGFLVTFIMHVKTGESKLAVYDARTMSSQPVATVPIPHRVPAGFHGLHIKEAELATQA